MTWPLRVMWQHRSRDHSICHMPFPIGGPLEPRTSVCLQPFLRCSKHIGVTNLTFQGHVTSSFTWPFGSQVGNSWSIATKSVSPVVVEIMGPKYIGSNGIDLSGSRDVIIHVTIRFAICRSYWWSIRTERQFPAVFEILGSKHIGVTILSFQVPNILVMTLTFLGHVTA